MKSNHSIGKMLYVLIFAVALCIGVFKPVTVEAADYTIIEITKSQISSKGAYEAIQEALDEAHDNATTSKPYKIIVSAEDKTYTLSNCLHIYSNTWLCVTGVTFKQGNSEANMIMLGRTTDSQEGYCYKNITIEGGTWNGLENSHTLIKIAHAKNITVTGCTFKNTVDAHLMETAGVSGLTITNCTFQNQVYTTDGSSSTQCYEAIQQFLTMR